MLLAMNLKSSKEDPSKLRNVALLWALLKEYEMNTENIELLTKKALKELK